MSMIEFDDNLDLDEEFDVLHGILEFPIKCLEEDEDVEDWDISNLECLGPVPSNVLTEIPMASDEKFNLQHPDLFPLPVTPITGALELMQLPKHVDTSGLHILPLRKFAKVQESPSFRTQSPVSVLERNGSHPREKSLSIKSDNVIPVRSRSKCVRYASINPWLLAAHGLSTSKQTPNANRSRKSRKILCQQSVATDLSKKFPRNVHSLDVSGPTHIHNISKKCSHCQSTKTPQWRWGPLGKNTLCNACGVRYRSGCLFPEYRPAASPTFSQSQHSSSHRKVTEMRNKANLLTAKLKVAPLSPKTEAKIEEPLIALQMEAKNLRPTSRQLEVQIVRAPVRKQLTKHVDTSSSLVHPRIIGTREQKQLVKHVDTSSSLFYPLIVRAPEQMKRPKHTDTTSSFIMPQKVGAPKKRRLVKHVDISWSPLSPKNAGAFKQKQLANDVDTSGSCISPQIIGAPKRKKLAKYDDTCSSYIPLQNKHASVQESGAFGDENQISLLESRVSCSRERSLSSMSSRLKHVKHTGTSSLLLVSSSTSKKTSNSSKGKESRNKKFQLPVATDALKDSPKNDENSLDFSGSARLQNASNHGHAHGKKCAHCQSTKTPQWREGPLGPRTLCNACGVRYRSGRLVPEYRPAASPTFVPSKHSNLHSEVVRMIKAEHTSLRPGVESKVPITYHHSQSLFHE